MFKPIFKTKIRNLIYRETLAYLEMRPSSFVATCPRIAQFANNYGFGVKIHNGNVCDFFPEFALFKPNLLQYGSYSGTWFGESSDEDNLKENQEYLKENQELRMLVLMFCIAMTD